MQSTALKQLQKNLLKQGNEYAIKFKKKKTVTLTILPMAGQMVKVDSYVMKKVEKVKRLGKKYPVSNFLRI